MNLKSLGLAILWFTIGHVLVWFQLNGQFIWPWFKKNELIVAALGGIISLFYIWGTAAGVAAFDGLLWPTRFVGFSIGILIYGVMIYVFFNEGINTKTAVSLALCTILIAIQVLWKQTS